MFNLILKRYTNARQHLFVFLRNYFIVFYKLGGKEDGTWSFISLRSTSRAEQMIMLLSMLKMQWTSCNWSYAVIYSLQLILRGFFNVLLGGGHICSREKFLGQRSNLCHSSDPSHCSDNAESLTCCVTREFQYFVLIQARHCVRL